MHCKIFLPPPKALHSPHAMLEKYHQQTKIDKFGEKIFGLYSRFHGSKIEGKGIGLHLVKVQAESLGGSVEIESKVNQGSKFIVRLPINPKENEID